jgi:ubiquinone/menaquinone biosynthesis C-methylase UbiE
MQDKRSSKDLAAVNIDCETITGFGREWSRFTQTGLGYDERERIFGDYFTVFPWERLPPGGGTGADIGCGSGRWALLVAPRVAHLHLVDASSEALSVARSNLAGIGNISYHHAIVDVLPFPDASLDFVYSLGVLHHVPDTQAAILALALKLKPGAPLLLYLYYAFDNRPWWFRYLWKISDLLRRGLVRMPWGVRYGISQVIAILVYWPLARTARWLERGGRLPSTWPLAYYRDKSFYVMRTDAIDRFGTRLEQRFTRAQIETMLRNAGFVDIRFSEKQPYWCVAAVKA